MRPERSGLSRILYPALIGYNILWNACTRTPHQMYFRTSRIHSVRETVRSARRRLRLQCRRLAFSLSSLAQCPDPRLHPEGGVTPLDMVAHWTRHESASHAYCFRRHGRFCDHRSDVRDFVNHRSSLLPHKTLTKVIRTTSTPTSASTISTSSSCDRRHGPLRRYAEAQQHRRHIPPSSSSRSEDALMLILISIYSRAPRPRPAHQLHTTSPSLPDRHVFNTSASPASSRS